MKKIIYYVIFGFICIFIPENTFAHTVGQMSFFKVNGVYSELYPVPAKSVESFSLPQDIAPNTYLVGEPISFSLDTSRLPLGDEESVKNKIFTWDFGNNDTFTGLETSYIYKKIGTYILTIHVRDETITQPFLIQSMMIHIIPNTEYKLPNAVVAINGFRKDPISVSFSKDLVFDASFSTKGTSEISSVFWDFGDTKLEKKV